MKIKKFILILLFITGCQMEPAPSFPPPVSPLPGSSFEKISDQLNQAGQDLLHQGKSVADSILHPPQPNRNLERPKLSIASDPATILKLGTFSSPATVLFEAVVNNTAQSDPIAKWNWKIVRLGIPFLKDDEVVYQGETQRFSFLFESAGRYRVTLSVETTQGEVVSTSVSFWARN